MTCPKVKKRGEGGGTILPSPPVEDGGSSGSINQISGALPPASHRSYGVRARRSKILVVENLDGAGVEVSNFWRQGDQIFLEKSAVTKKNSYVH